MVYTAWGALVNRMKHFKIMEKGDSPCWCQAKIFTFAAPYPGVESYRNWDGASAQVITREALLWW